MAIISVKSLLEAGVHFGHRVSRWNPKMAPYIFGRRNLIHIINLSETVKGLIRAYYFLKKIAAEGQTILFVGTKRQAKLVIRREAERCHMPYVAERWLGGSLTNFTTIRARLARLEDLERMEKDGTMDSMGKKMASTLRREKRKIFRNLEGIRQMEKLPGAILVVDPQKEHLAVHEAAKLNIPTIALMDTDSDPDLIDIPIPGNDDAMRSIELIFGKLTDAIVAGQSEWDEKQKIDAKRRQEAFPPRDDRRHGESKPGMHHGEQRHFGERKDREGEQQQQRRERFPKAEEQVQDLATTHTPQAPRQGGTGGKTQGGNRRPPRTGGGTSTGRRDFHRGGSGGNRQGGQGSQGSQGGEHRSFGGGNRPIGEHPAPYQTKYQKEQAAKEAAAKAGASQQPPTQTPPPPPPENKQPPQQ